MTVGADDPPEPEPAPVDHANVSTGLGQVDSDNAGCPSSPLTTTGSAPNRNGCQYDRVAVEVFEHRAVTVLVTGSERARVEPGADWLATLLASALADQGVRTPAEVGLGLVDAETMAELNAAHMGADGPTDVLAFPIDGVGPASTPGQPTMVGDIVIAPEVARRSSQPLADEMALLVVHGALHLLGHDHGEPDEKAVMWQAQADLLDRLWAGGGEDGDVAAEAAGARADAAGDGFGR